MNLSHLFLITLTVLALSAFAKSDPEPRNDHAVRKRQEVLQARRRQADIEHKEDLKRKIADFKARRRQKELEEAMKRHAALRHQRLGKSRTDQKPLGRRRSSPRRVRGRYQAKKRSPPALAKRQNSGGMGRRRQNRKFAARKRIKFPPINAIKVEIPKKDQKKPKDSIMFTYQ